MAEYINQHSFVLSGVFVLAIAAFFLLRDGPKSSDYLILALLAAALFGAWWLLRPRASVSGQAVDVQARIGRGTPVLLEFQSPY